MIIFYADYLKANRYIISKEEKKERDWKEEKKSRRGRVTGGREKWMEGSREGKAEERKKDVTSAIFNEYLL